MSPTELLLNFLPQATNSVHANITVIFFSLFTLGSIQEYKIIQTKKPLSITERPSIANLNFLFVSFRAANSQALSSAFASCCKYTASVCGWHALPEAMLILSFALRGLKSTFHVIPYLNFINSPFSKGLQIYAYF